MCEWLCYFSQNSFEWWIFYKCLFLKTPDLKVDHASWNLICSHRESSFEDLLLVVYLQQRRYTVDKVILVNYLKLQVEVPWQHWLAKKNTLAVILLPLHVASLTHQNPQRCKIIHGMRPIGRKEFGRISCSWVWILWLLFKDAYLF